jgi:transcription elongation GreA/GreB family factor
MELTGKLLTELQKRLKVGNRRGIHLNAIPANSRYKFDLSRLSYIDKNLPNNFVKALLTEQPLKFRISWKNNVPDLNSLYEEDQAQLVKITRAFENLINQTEAIESEKGINTFGFGFPILIRRDQLDNKLTVAPILIWSLRIKRTKEFNTWEITRNEDDPIYLNEVLVNHLQSDSKIELAQIPSEMLDDGLISKDELTEICTNLIKALNNSVPNDLLDTFNKKLENISSIGDKGHYEKLPINSTNALIDFCGLFSIFEVQKQNIINDYDNLIDLENLSIDLHDLEGHSFQPISSVETDPSQQSILNSLELTRNILIQGPPGTGKSQTLTAILINALENQKKTIVVCEKRTALEVLHNALIEKGLNYHCVLVRDIVKDRKTVVDSVRDRVDNSTYRRYSYSYSKESLDLLITKAKNLINSINNKHKKIDKKLLGNKSWTDIVGELLAELKSNKDELNLNLDKNIFNYTSQELDHLTAIVQKGQTLYKDFKPIESKSFLNPKKLIGENPYLIEQKIRDDFDFYKRQLASIKSFLEANRLEYFNLRREELNQQCSSINNLIDTILEKVKEFDNLFENIRNRYFDFRNLELTNQKESFAKFITEIEIIFDNNKNNPDLLNEKKIKSFAFKIFSTFSKLKKCTIIDYRNLQVLFESLEKTITSSKDFEDVRFSGDVESKRKILEVFNSQTTNVSKGFSNKLQKEFELFYFHHIFHAHNIQDLFESIEKTLDNSKRSESFTTFLREIMEEVNQYQSDLSMLFQNLTDLLQQSKDISAKHNFKGSINNKKSTLPLVRSDIDSIRQKFDSQIHHEFQKLSLLKTNVSVLGLTNLPNLQNKVKELADKITSDNWTLDIVNNNDLTKFLIEVEQILKNHQKYFSHENDLFTIEFKWFQFYNQLANWNKNLINELKGKSDWRRALIIHYLNSLLVNSANMDLPTSDNEHIELNDTLGGIENEQLKYIREYWFSKQIDTSREFEQRSNNISVENLYNKRSSNRFRRLSLRQIVQYDANLFTTFFPIILTSPDVCCNLFKKMNGYFDIVMFDEASQLRLEDNLPALLKGKQIIIAGDEHQMPPSNYFSKVFDGSVEDEDDVEEEVVVDKDNLLLSCESLLDFGSELNIEKKYLDFHYRSRHPYLIDFSNHAFYNQRLKPLPNDFDYTPIKYVQVNGTFSEYTNEAEAEMVLSIIEHNIHKLPNGKYPTLGVATFNIAQRNLIKSKILERQKFSKHEKFNAKIQNLEENGMFIKNLENIQGDEKDVIILSTTYGIGKEGKFAQRFGPINHSKGYRLLNVIITRAKYKVYVCSSIPEEVFMNYKEYLAVEGANNKRAVFYAYLAYSKAVSENSDDLRLSVLTALDENTSKSTNFVTFKGGELESPFEEEVYQALADNFGVEKLIPQLQYAGFRIDIVYDPKISGAPKIAIECDGAKYHSSREAYLYDSHRQKILESHGFVFHRIWSTNWWRNSKRETNKLVDSIKNIESTSSFKLKDYSKTALAFTDEIENIENYVSEISFIDHEKDAITIQAIEKKTTQQTKLFKDEVRLNSEVKVKYINNGKDLSVHIVNSNPNNYEPSNGIKKIYFKSPLASSILGHTVGDIVKVGNLDNYVEIIEITNK